MWLHLYPHFQVNGAILILVNGPPTSNERASKASEASQYAQDAGYSPDFAGPFALTLRGSVGILTRLRSPLSWLLVSGLDHSAFERV